MNATIRALVGAAFVVATPAAATNVLQNPGFETGLLTPWYQNASYSDGTDWFVTSGVCQSGTYCAEDTGNKELRQDFAGVAASSVLQVSFWAEHPNALTQPDLAYDFYYSDNTYAEFLVQLVGTDWNFFDVTAQLDAAKTLIGFSVFGNDTSFGSPPVTRVDNLLIDVPGAGGVPEPATWAMMLLGFGAMGVSLRWRRRRAAAEVIA
jgi:hypothetical protein